MANLTADQRFSIGELVIYTSITYGWTEQATVVRGPELLWCSLKDGTPDIKYGYYVKVPSRVSRAGRHIFFGEPPQLRKIQPPREELGDWELIPWARPTKEKARV